MVITAFEDYCRNHDREKDKVVYFRPYINDVIIILIDLVVCIFQRTKFFYSLILLLLRDFLSKPFFKSNYRRIYYGGFIKFRI